MNNTTVFSKFSQGVNWNGIFYSTYKTFTTILSFLLFKFLTTQDFSVWANINSVIFLLLLWLDFGFRKSIPRYLPEFAKNRETHKRFIQYILYFQFSILLIATPLVMYLGNTFTKSLNMQLYFTFFYMGGAIFLTEGLIAILRLIYHAHFWNKQFNILTMTALFFEMTANIIILCCFKQSTEILTGILLTKIASGIFVNIVGLLMLTKLYKDKNYPGNQELEFKPTFVAFIKHSGIMWVSTTIKSMTERNFLMPLFTYVFGPASANMFKVANDGALFFHRIALKTIGTTDTSLLSHIQTSPDKEKLMPIAFKELITKIISLCVPLTAILLALLLKKDVLFSNTFAAQLFFIMTIAYLTELIASPYERMLEIKRRYSLLFLSYAPYIAMLIVLFSSSTSSVDLVSSIIIIHSIRLVSSFLMLYFARRKYPYLHFPIPYLIKVITLCVPLFLICCGAITYSPVATHYISTLISSK